MRPKLLFWLAAAMAVMGMHSPDGNLFYFFSAHWSMLMIGFLFHRRELRNRAAAMAGASPSRPTVAVTQSKSPDR
jgi:hypothetical protein